MLRLPRLLNLIYHWWTRGATAEQRADVDAMLRDAAELDLARPRAAATEAEHVPGTAPKGIRPPAWWKGNRAAFRSSVKAGQQLGEPAAMGVDVDGLRRPPPQIGSRPVPAGR